MLPASIRHGLGLMALPLLLNAGSMPGAELPSASQAGRPSRHGHMPLTAANLEQWAQERINAPTVSFAPTKGQPKAKASADAIAGVVNFLGEVSTVGAIRDQGSNGDCWVWAPCAMAEVALQESYGFKDSLSTEYVDSLMDAYNWANGGSLTAFCGYVNATGLLVPWANANAAYVDGVANGLVSHSLIPTSSIQQMPAYTHVTVQGNTVPTIGVGQATAIANIKTLLDQHKAVGFSFITQFACIGGFDDWWENNPESALWPEPVTGPTGTPDGCWGAHMVTLVGYDQTDPSPANHYWIVLNSWGISTNRPNGLFHLPMAMNYQASFTSNGKSYQNYSFETLTLTVDHPAATVPTVTVAVSDPLPKLGQPLTFTATASGQPPFTYQWRKDGQTIAGAASAAYSLPYLLSSDAGHGYDVVVSNLVGGLAVNTPSPIEFVPSMAGQQQLLLNPGFEDGASQTAWTFTDTSYWSGGTGFQDVPAYSHGGEWSAFIGLANYGNYFTGSLEQTLTIPPGPGSVLMGYWANATTGWFFGPGQGSLYISIKDAATGQVLRTGKFHRNRDADVLLWSHDQFGLSDLKGQRVTIHIDGYAEMCQWRLDDFALTVDPADSRPLPVITAFSPTSGNPGDPVVLMGSGFTGTSLLQFNGLATPFTVNNDTQIMTVVTKADFWGGDSVTSGLISINTPIGTAFSPTPFRVLRPKVLSCNPGGATRGSVLILKGSGFTGVSAVAFDGVAGPASVPASFSVDSDTQITTIIPVYAIAGGITLTNPYGTAWASITVLPSGAVSIVISPRPLAVIAGSTLTFTATVTGDIDQRASFQLDYRSQQQSLTWSGAPNPFTFTLDPTAGSLSLVVAWYGSPLTVADSLTIPIKNLDFLGTGIVDVLDMLELAKRYGSKAGDASFSVAADLDGNGIIDDNDVTLFLNHF
jgi:hypothetical protein